MSQKTRASGALGSPQGSSSNVLGSGTASTSPSWTRLKPSIEEPSNVMPSSSAFSSSAGLMAKLLSLPEDVGEPQPDEADAALLHGPQDVVLLPLTCSPPPVWRAGVRRRPAPRPPATAGATVRASAEQMVSTIRRATTYGSMLAFGPPVLDVALAVLGTCHGMRTDAPRSDTP